MKNKYVDILTTTRKAFITINKSTEQAIKNVCVHLRAYLTFCWAVDSCSRKIKSEVRSYLWLKRTVTGFQIQPSTLFLILSLHFLLKL